MLLEFELMQAPILTPPTSWQKFVALTCHLAEIILPSEGVSQPHLREFPISVMRQLSGKELVTMHLNGGESAAKANIKLIHGTLLIKWPPFLAHTESLHALPLLRSS